jgi:hypothetical protein
MAVHDESATHLTSADRRSEILADPGFGRYFTDHMIRSDYRNGAWSAIQILPYEPLSLRPLPPHCPGASRTSCPGRWRAGGLLRQTPRPCSASSTACAASDRAAHPDRPRAAPAAVPHRRQAFHCDFGQVSRCVQPSAGARPGMLPDPDDQIRTDEQTWSSHDRKTAAARVKR